MSKPTDPIRQQAARHLDERDMASQSSLFSHNSAASPGRLVYPSGMAALETDDPLAAENPPDWVPVSGYDKLRWSQYDRTERKRALGRAAMRQTEEFNREHERQQRLKAEAAAAASVTLPVVPSAAECSALLLSNPGALASMQERALVAFRRTRALPGCPYQQLDAELSAFRHALANQPPVEMLRICCEAERDLIEFGLRKDEFGLLAWQSDQARRSAVELAAGESMRLNGQAFDASRFISQLASKGIRLAPAGGDDRIIVSGNRDALSGTDIATLGANRTAIAAALRLEVEI
jgi:hypothetical protein